MHYRLRHVDGGYRWHLGRAVPSLDGAGRVLRWYGTATDIDAQKRADEERAVLLQREQQARELREQFLAIVGHDLRNPLMSVALGADLLLDGSEPVTPKQSMVLKRICQSTERMNKLIGQLMDFAQARAGVELPIELGDTSLNDVCREVADECALGYEREVRIEADHEVRGHWDSDRLEEVVSNLIGNAMQHGDPSPVTLRLAQSGEHAILSVHNGGSPIPEATLPHIFDPFRRGPSKKKSSSIGLGLFITQQIVLSHQGTVEVRSTEREGTTFTVTLPLLPRIPERAGEAS
jgi:signal transduction histidine kinase